MVADFVDIDAEVVEGHHHADLVLLARDEEREGRHTVVPDVRWESGFEMHEPLLKCLDQDFNSDGI